MKTEFLCLKGLLMAAVIALASSAVFAQDSRARSDLRRSFSRFDLVKIENSKLSDSSRLLKVRAGGRDHKLEIEPNDMLASNYRAENSTALGTVAVERPVIRTYKGKVAGSERSEVRVSINGQEIEGFFDAYGERFFIEPAKKYSDAAGADRSVVYREEDLINNEPFFCSADIPQSIADGVSMLNANKASAILASRNLEVATEADSEYVTRLGGAANANNNILGILNMIEGTYASELDLEITVTFQHTWSAADPFTGTNSGDLLLSFTDYWNANYPVSTNNRDVAHLFSGKSYVLSAGIAFVGAVCTGGDYAYGVSGYVSWAPGKYLVPAHEIGHNLGAEHAEASQGCANTLMNAFLSGSTALSFCPFSRNEIGTFLTGHSSCLSGGSTPTPTPTPIPTPTPNPNAGVRFDFDGDGRADIAVFRPSNGHWYLNRSSAGFTDFQFGQAGDIPVAADYDGDGKTDAAVYRAGVWYRKRSSSNSYDSASFGIAGDIPVPADLDGDGRADIAVFRPSTGQWYWIGSFANNFSSASFGIVGDLPMPADFDGDRRADITVFRPSTGVWYRINSSNSSFSAHQFGASGDNPVSGDFDGDGQADLAVWRPSTATWYYIGSGSRVFESSMFGNSADVPAVADFNGDGRADISVYRPSTGMWYRIDSGQNTFTAIQYGQPGDEPATSDYLN